jgi:hypothetical protein
MKNRVNLCEKSKRNYIKQYILLSKAFVSIGCFMSSSGCNYADVFLELGISSTQCATAISSFTGMTCYTGTCSYKEIYSSTSITVEKCLQICTPYGFIYAGIQT